MTTYNEYETNDLLVKMFQGTNAGKFKIQIPPPSYLDMKTEIIEYEKNKRLIASFPVMESQTNPLGMMQGGYIAAAFDNVYGPLSYLVAKKPSTTLGLNVQYIRSVEAGKKIIVEAKIDAIGFSTMHMSAEMRSETGKLLATSTTNLLILKIPPKE